MYSTLTPSKTFHWTVRFLTRIATQFRPRHPLREMERIWVMIYNSAGGKEETEPPCNLLLVGKRQALSMVVGL